jgi:hypothetical protein
MSVAIDAFFDEKRDGYWRSGASIDGEEVWFESKDTPLSASGEALGCAFVIPALLQGLEIRISEPVCAEWKENIRNLTQLLGEAWGSPTTLAIDAKTTERKPLEGRLRGQFFSGGVDSFYELITTEKAPEALICLHGFDMDLAEAAKFEHLQKGVSEICAERQIESVFLRTNIKKNATIAAVSWDDAHGGVLAAIGHLLSTKFHSVVIPPSWGQSSWRSLWGSHWKIDPLWSSQVLKVVHGDASATRLERIRRISTEPAVQRNLRVCWSEQARQGNCSSCPKCVRTMAVLHDCGQLENFTAFDSTVPIWDRIDQLPFAAATITYDELLEKGVEPKLEKAIRRLIKRSYGVALRAEYAFAHNKDLVEANEQLEKQLLSLQRTIREMSNTRVWKAGKVFRHFRKLLKSTE